MIFKLPKNDADYKGLIFSGYPIVSSIKASSFQDDTTRYPGNLINYSTDQWWCSNPIENSYFELTFKIPVYIVNVSFRVREWGNSQHYPINLEMTGSLNKNKEIISGEIQNIWLNNITLSRTQSTSNVGPFNEFKVKQIGKNFIQSEYFCLAKFDIFGYTDLYFFTCDRIQTFKIEILFILICQL